jgi:hypothetical protein
MNKINTTSALLLLTALYLNAQITDTINNHIGSSPSILPSYDETTNPDNEKSTEFEKEHLTTSSEQSTDRSFESQADISSISKQNICNADATADTKSPKLSDVQWGATVDMQVDKEMGDEFGMDSKNRLQHSSLTHAYRRIVDDFWMRVALRAKYQYRFIESAFALRFYPYWTLRRKGGFEKGADLDMFMDVLEINQAYIKFYKEYNSNSNKFAAHLKIGRDGLLSTGSQLFGNYLELPTAGYGDSRSANVTGPFKNRKVFANQLEIGFNFKISDVLSGTTSLMRGGNVNNRQWYTAPSPAISEEMDSRLSAGFTRGYQDLYFWNERIHFGAGFRIYTTKVSKTAQLYFTNESNELDSTVTSFATNSKYIMETGHSILQSCQV